VYYEQPGAQSVDEVMQPVGVCNAVDGRVEGERECEGVGEEADAVRNILEQFQ
jgi:hypothetical protein